MWHMVVDGRTRTIVVHSAAAGRYILAAIAGGGHQASAAQERRMTLRALRANDGRCRRRC